MRSQDSIDENSSWEAIEFDYEELSISKSIVARGQFGASFMLGRIRTCRPLPHHIDEMTTMKSCRESDEHKCCSGLRSEINVLYDLCHTNVIKLIGYCHSEQDKVYRLVTVFEYCANGNLSKVLQKGRPYFNVGTYCPKKAINNEELCTSGIFLNFSGWHLLRWATEIARGLEYLSFKGVIHGDLAARNVLLTCDWTAKICNFGIAQRQKVQESTFAKQLSKQVLPLAWMAPETIRSFTYSELSDVYSFGITLWEIFTLGDVPYREDNISVDSKFWLLLMQDVRPSRPLHANDHMWDLIKSCWSYDPKRRPVFSKIKIFLEKTVLATRSDWGSTLSRQDCSTRKQSTSTVTQERKASKVVTFAQQIPGGVLRKCFNAADDVLFGHRLKSR